MQMVGSVGMLWYEMSDEGLAAVVEHLRSELIDNKSETMKLGVPAGLYTIQNNLLFVALSNLDATTYQVSLTSWAARATAVYSLPGDCHLCAAPSQHATVTS